MEEVNIKSLYQAIELKNLNRVRDILSIDSKLSQYEKDEYSPLWQAAMSSYEEIVEILLQFGADPNQKSVIKKSVYYDYTFIQYISNCDFNEKNNKIAEVLIKYGADVNLGDNKIFTSLQMAIRNGNLEGVEFLLKNGARLEGSEWNGESPARHAFESIQDDLICKKMLILLLNNGLNINFRSKYDETLLHSLICYGRPRSDANILELTQILLDAGVSLDYVIEFEGESALICALFMRRPELAKFLIHLGADVKMEGNNRQPLFWAVFDGNEDIIDLILTRGADINAKDHNEETALHFACEVNSSKIISFLLRKGANTNVKDENGGTPFSMISPDLDDYDKSVRVMVKKFSELSFENIPILKEDMDLLQETQIARDHFQKCTAELNQMASTKFYAPYSYYSVLRMSKCIKKLASLTKNEDFVTNFEKNLSAFSCYESDLRTIFEEATQFRDRSNIVQSRLYSVFREIFPDIVIKKLAKNLTVEDLPL